MSPAVATVDANGVVTCLAPGAATIMAASGSISGQSLVTVTPPPGTLDTSFGGTGYVTTQIANTYSGAIAVAPQSDGKIVVAGSSAASGGCFSIARYNTDGSPDTRFGGGTGYVTTPGGYASVATALAIQSDGKIVAAGVFGPPYGTEYDFAVVRYNADGSLDTTFGGGAGYVLTAFTAPDYSFANAVAIQSDGKIVAAGGYGSSSAVYGAAVVRYNTDGSLDPTFGGGTGKVTTPLGYAAGGMGIQGDGKIVVATANLNSVVRYNPDGSLDLTFAGGHGYLLTNLGGGDCALADGMTLQSDGRIVIAGGCFMNGYNIGLQAVVARYQTDGSIDASFGGTGYVTLLINVETIAAAVAVQDDGRIVLAGNSRYSSGRLAFTVARRNADGSPDLTFGSGTGYVITPIMQSNGYDSWALGVAIRPSDEKIIAVGETFYLDTQNNVAYAYMAVAQYWP